MFSSREYISSPKGYRLKEGILEPQKRGENTAAMPHFLVVFLKTGFASDSFHKTSCILKSRRQTGD